MNVANSLSDRQRLALTVSDFRILAEAGAFDGRPKVELIDGVIVTLSPQQNIHSFAKSELGRRLGNKIEQLGLPYRAIVEGTLALSSNCAVNPDIAVSSDRPTKGYMDSGSVILAVEVANTSETFDLGAKAALYAEAGIPEYWVLLLEKKMLVRHWEAGQSGYGQRDRVPLGQPFLSANIPHLIIESDGLI